MSHRHLRRLVARALPAVGPVLRSGPALRALQRLDAVSFLTYHDVSDAPPDGLSPGLVTSTARFTRDLEWLTRHFEIIAIDEAVERVRSGRLQGHAMVLSFDDGYRGVLEHAYPLLSAMKLPMVLFLNAAFFLGEQVGLRIKLEVLLTRYSWAELSRAIPGPVNRAQFVALARRTLTADCRRTIDELFHRATANGFRDPYLHQSDLDSMSPALVTVANHTRSHRWLAGLGRGEQLAEICEGHRALAELPHFRPYLAVPFGTPDSFDEITVDIASREYGGVLITSYGGLNTARRRRGAIHDVVRNSVSERKPALLQLLWSNHLLSFATRH